MFIKSLTIKNFRCFGKGANGKGTTINLNKGLTAFIGRNGSGKTVILEALNYLIGSDYLPTKISEKDFHKEASGTKMEDAIIIEGETENPFYVDIDVISNTNIASKVIVPCNKIRLFIKRREKAEKILDDPFRIEKTVVPILGNIDDSIYQSQNFKKSYKIILLSEVDSVVSDLDSAKEIIKDLLKGITTEAAQTDRFYQIKFKIKSGVIREASFPSYSLTFNPNRIKGLAKSYYLSKDRNKDVAGSYSLIFKILTDLHWRYKKKQANNESDLIPQEYDTLAGLLRSIVDEKGVLIRKINDKVKSVCCEDNNFQIDFIDIEQPYKSAFIAKKEGEKLLLPENLGSGFNILIAYALFAYVADQEKIPIVLIVDEPELHLHSDWQKKMYDIFTKQTDLQIIYSSQSENFISLKNWKQIRAISNFQIFPKEEVLQEQIAATDGQTGTRADYLDDYATKNLDISTVLRENLELFFAKKCILVEGPSEKYGLPKLLKLSGCDVDNFSVSIIPAWGKTKIKNYQMICKVFGIDYFTIFDNDKATEDEPTNENTAIENNVQNEQKIKFSTSFELKLGVIGDNKFQKIVKKIDELTDINLLDQEIKGCTNNLKTFIESNNLGTI
ncbi:MAG: AAA family ATPase [Patescibacteria group bacterium]|jgi:predicted ATP-dependent endonuclease of OLD family